MKSNVFIVLFCASILSPSWGQSLYTLSECLTMVRSNSVAAKEIDLNNRMNQIQQKIIGRNYLPQATLGGKASWQSDVTSLPIELPNFDIPTVPKEQFSVAIDINQMILDGGISRAHSEIKTWETEIKNGQSQSGLLAWENQGIQLFYRIALQQELVSITDLLIAQLEQNIRQATSNMEAGLLIRQDVLIIEVKKLEALQQKKEYESQLYAASRSLAELMNTDDTLIRVSIQNVETPDTPLNFDQRPDIQIQDLKKRLIAAQERLIVAENQPRMSAFLTSGYGRPGLNFLNDQFDFYTLAGIKIAVPLDHFYSRKVALQKQGFRLEQESAQLVKEDLTRRLSTQAVNYFEEIEKLLDWLSEDRKIVEIREEMSNVSEAQWQGGTLATTQYLNNISDLSLAKIRLTTHEIMLNRTRSLYLNLIGRNLHKQ